jgi:hypothetical protein
MTDLARARSDLGTFSEAIGVPLTGWQARALRLRKRTTVIVAPRQSGKSRALGVLALHRAFARPAHRTLVISAGEDASRRLLAEAAAVAMHSSLLSGSVVDETTGLLTLSNGSEVRSVPASERAIRGWTVDLLLVDEAVQVEDDLLLNAAVPTTAARPDARIVLASSPGAPEGAFYAFAQQGDNGSEHVSTFRWSLEAATWIEPSVIESARESLAPAAFQREFLGTFASVSAEERVLPREWIEAGLKRSLAPGSPAFGLDVARSGVDSTVLCCVRGGTARVAWSHHGADLMQTADRVAATSSAEKGPGPPILVDAIGLGAGVFDRLRQMGVPNVHPFISSARASRPDRFLNLRAEAFWTTREAFRLAEVDLDPQDRELAEQLGSVGYKLAPSGAIQIADKAAMKKSPDRAEALVYAIWARAQHERSEQVSLLLADAQRQLVEDPLLAGTRPISEVQWNGRGRRGSWRDRMGWDSDLPTLS